MVKGKTMRRWCNADEKIMILMETLMIVVVFDVLISETLMISMETLKNINDYKTQ